ncbi:adhesion G-protein coupled receptor D2 isoform X2 [Alosa sapidissima]|uniref:adhesion G-protein coupled receptor D2 isoform X2 n=1 Tax=Alosa sapidissima TaxID=34773 RepID=UPI001C082E42|nr:adhesion G-protein coupled receptor D2 isoform X2 [Alosa sapidissima]
MTGMLFIILLAHAVVVSESEPTQPGLERGGQDSEEVGVIDLVLVHMTEDKVFQLINASLSFQWARRFCRSHFSMLTLKESQEDEEGALWLLKEFQLQEPIWVVDGNRPLFRESVAVSKQYKVLPTLSFSLDTMEGHARLNTHFPLLHAVSVCVRIQWDQRHNQVSTIFSYAASVFINEFQLRGRADGADQQVLLALIVHGHHCPYKASFPNDGEWHLVCVSWRYRDGLWAIYVDGEMRDTGTQTDTTREIHGDGIFIVGQDQDSFGGDFTEPFVGNITDLNVWDRVLEEEQIQTLKACWPLENQDALFSWTSQNLTLHPDVKGIPANIYCPGIQRQSGREECDVLQGWSSHHLPQYSKQLCSEELPFICRTSKKRYMIMKELKEVQSSRPSPFMSHLMQVSGDTQVMEEPVAGISLGQASHLLNVSQQALSETRKPLEPADVLSLMQILSRAAEVSTVANESRTTIEQLSQHFVTVADNIISSDNARMWNVVKEVASGPMSVVRSIDRMVTNLNPLLIADRDVVQIQSDNIKLQVQQRSLGEGTESSNFCGPLSENNTGLDCISLPSQQMEELHSNGFRKVTFLNTWYGSLQQLFNTEENITTFPEISDGTQRFLGTILGSSVISSTVLGDGQPISMPVRFQLQHRTQNPTGFVYEPICAFWDFNLMPEDGGSWSSYGCEVLSTQEDSTTCSCNHTTSFALLLQIYEVERSPGDEKTLQMLTFTGCGVSLCGLILTLILFTAVGVPKSDRTTVHKNLIVALAVAQLLLMISDWASTNHEACLLVTALLHLFFMASFSWMLVEGLLLWSKVVSVNISEERRMRFYYALGWGLPVVIVTLTLTISLNKYKADNHCWLNIESDIIWAFVGPVLFVLAVNTVVLCRVVMVTVSSAQRRAKMLSPSSVSKLHTFDLTWAATRPVLILLPVLGLTWLCGVLVHTSVVVAYIFIILNAFQGLYIFLVYAVYNSEVRNAIKRIQEKRKALSFTNCSQPISFLPSQRTPTAFWAQSLPTPSSLENSDASSPVTSTTSSSLVFKNESFRKDSFVSFSLKPASGNQVCHLQQHHFLSCSCG